MQLAKVIKFLASSTRSWEDADQNAIRALFGSLRYIRDVDVIKRTVSVGQDNVMRYGVTLNVTLHGEDHADLVEARLGNMLVAAMTGVRDYSSTFCYRKTQEAAAGWCGGTLSIT